MELLLSENIRMFRKERKLTQEQLAEVLSVTTGAVYKWEAGMSVPELNLIVEMADFFDTSVDVLLGYQMKDNRLDMIVQRLSEYLRRGDTEAISEAEKALKKYPNSFEIVHASAIVYQVFGTERHDREKLRRALELLEQSVLLISQNTNPEISESFIYGEIGSAWISLGESEKGLEILKKHNTGGIFNDTIGVTLATFLHRAEEAEPFLSEAFILSAAQMVNIIAGYAFLYDARGDYGMEREIVLWGLAFFSSLKAADTPSFMDKTQAILYTLQANVGVRTGETAAARASLQQMLSYVRRFDTAPDYSLAAIRFISAPESSVMHDSLGTTAKESVEKVIQLLGNPSLESLWKEVLEDAE